MNRVKEAIFSKSIYSLDTKSKKLITSNPCEISLNIIILQAKKQIKHLFKGTKKY